MVFDESDTWRGFAISTSATLPVAWLVFRIHASIIGWMLANVDAANPAHSPVREFIMSAISLPIPAVWRLAYPWICWDYDLLLCVGFNALGWEFLLAPVTSGAIGNSLRLANVTGELISPDSGLAHLFGL